MIRVLKGLANTIRSEGTSSPESRKANASSYWLRKPGGIQSIVAEILRAGVIDAALLQVAPLRIEHAIDAVCFVIGARLRSCH